jgi:hypothetical protein
MVRYGSRWVVGPASGRSWLSRWETFRTEQEQQDLWTLRTRWLGVYHFGFTDGAWRAYRFSEPHITFTADTADELDTQIALDYGKVILSS